ncbi:MAG: hypothetical protein HYZ16_02370 [Bacteroidetes bacterium]|jgi:hypothetical protein|nr:hypothetical protein [Bacteroidota bacterium]
MSSQQPSAVLTKDNVRQWRDFLDVLLFARQNRCELVVPDRYPELNTLLEIQGNIGPSIHQINRDYARCYKNLRVYRGEFDNISSLLVLKNMKVSSGRLFQKSGDQRLLCYTSNQARVNELEVHSDFLAIALYGEGNYVGTKVFMREHMIELLSL